MVLGKSVDGRRETFHNRQRHNPITRFASELPNQDFGSALHAAFRPHETVRTGKHSNGHGDYGGHRAPRDHTISFRLQDARGKYRTNVVWLMPDWLRSLTVEDVRALVAEANGKRK